MEPTSIAQVVGANLAAIRNRHKLTTEQIAKAAKLYGLRWSDSRVSAMERGRIPATLPTLFALAQALGDVSGTRISLAELAAFDGWVEINSDLAVSGDALRAALSGSRLDLAYDDILGGAEQIESITHGLGENLDEWHEIPGRFRETVGFGRASKAAARSGVAEDRLIQKLGISPLLFATVSLHLWKRTFSEERDHRAGPNANAQRRGQITRTLKSEIQDALELHNGND